MKRIVFLLILVLVMTQGVFASDDIALNDASFIFVEDEFEPYGICMLDVASLTDDFFFMQTPGTNAIVTNDGECMNGFRATSLKNGEKSLFSITDVEESDNSAFNVTFTSEGETHSLLLSPATRANNILDSILRTPQYFDGEELQFEMLRDRERVIAEKEVCSLEPEAVEGTTISYCLERSSGEQCYPLFTFGEYFSDTTHNAIIACHEDLSTLFPCSEAGRVALFKVACNATNDGEAVAFNKLEFLGTELVKYIPPEREEEWTVEVSKKPRPASTDWAWDALRYDDVYEEVDERIFGCQEVPVWRANDHAGMSMPQWLVEGVADDDHYFLFSTPGEEIQTTWEHQIPDIIRSTYFFGLKESSEFSWPLIRFLPFKERVATVYNDLFSQIASLEEALESASEEEQTAIEKELAEALDRKKTIQRLHLTLQPQRKSFHWEIVQGPLLAPPGLGIEENVYVLRPICWLDTFESERRASLEPIYRLADLIKKKGELWYAFDTNFQTLEFRDNAHMHAYKLRGTFTTTFNGAEEYVLHYVDYPPIGAIDQRDLLIVYVEDTDEKIRHAFYDRSLDGITSVKVDSYRTASTGMRYRDYSPEESFGPERDMRVWTQERLADAQAEYMLLIKQLQEEEGLAFKYRIV
jgi:hypothetical protein